MIKKQSLIDTHPEIAKEWHPTKNGSLSPKKISYGSEKKVWWKCNKAEDHVWKTSPNARSSGRGCPFCSGNKLTLSNSLLAINPKLSKEWHPIKNGKLTPRDVTKSSSKVVWWRCDKGDDHVWKASVANRSIGRGCPICSNRKVVPSNSLVKLFPEIAKQWHPTKNGDLTPMNVSPGGAKKVWWKCDKGDDHEWEAQVAKRAAGRKCPICSGHKVVSSNSLKHLYPEIAKQFHPTKNGKIKPENVYAFGAKYYWWKCNKGDDHEWRTKVEHRTKTGSGCPICSSRIITKSNNLHKTHPYLAKQWHPKRNGKLTPSDVGAGSNKRVWWKCNKGDDHVWATTVSNRAFSSSGCSVCDGKIIVLSNCLATTHPVLAKQWHPTKNGNLTPYNVMRNTGNVKVWWKCDKGDDHEWRVSPNGRRNRDCPFCTLTPQSKQELIITFELKKIFKDINPKGYKTRINGKLRSIDVFIPMYNLCIEFDGSYWHKGKREMDKIKSEMLLDEGYKLIRVREEPLKKIYDTDVVSSQPYDGKKITNDILSVIIKMYKLNKKQLTEIKVYKSKNELQNENALDRYIDSILEEKAKRKTKNKS